MCLLWKNLRIAVGSSVTIVAQTYVKSNSGVDHFRSRRMSQQVLRSAFSLGERGVVFDF